MKGRHNKYREQKVKNEFQDLESATTTMQRFIPDLKKLKVIRPFPHTTLAPGPPAVSRNESIVKSNSAVSVDRKSWLASASRVITRSWIWEIGPDENDHR